MSRRSSRSPAVVLGLGALLGALTWTAWLGWDRATARRRRAERESATEREVGGR